MDKSAFTELERLMWRRVAAKERGIAPSSVEVSKWPEKMARNSASLS
jgi:hypothetical protein